MLTRKGMGGGKWQCMRITMNYMIPHSGESDRQGMVKTLKEQGQQRGMLGGCYPIISVSTGCGSLRDKKMEREKK